MACTLVWWVISPAKGLQVPAKVYRNAPSQAMDQISHAYFKFFCNTASIHLVLSIRALGHLIV